MYFSQSLPPPTEKLWIGATGWHDRQHPDGTIIWTSPTEHTYTTHPGSRLLFPTLCRPTATLWTTDPPTTTPHQHRGLAMPRRRNTRAHNRTRAITTERQHNRTHRIHDSNTTATGEPPPNHDPYQSPSRWHEPGYGNDPPPF